MELLNCLQSAIDLVIPSKNVDQIVGESTGGVLRSRFMETEFAVLVRGVEPFILCDAVVLAICKLLLVKAVIAAKSVDNAIQMNSSEEGLLLWKRTLNFDSFSCVLETSCRVILPSKNEESHFVGDIDKGEVGGKICLVVPFQFPLKNIRRHFLLELFLPSCVREI